MNIILVSGRLAKARTVTLTRPQLAFALAGFVMAVVLLTTALNYFTLRHAAATNNPLVESLFEGVSQNEYDRAQARMRETVNALAVRLGQMQAQLLRLDTVGERLARLSGIKTQDFFDQLPGRGGAVTHLPQQDLTVSQITVQLDELTRLLNHRSDQLDVIESLLMQDRLTKKMVPSVSPVQGGWYSSNFGWRIDPFTGRNAMHEGVDFVALTGTAILAAAAGVVVFSDKHPEYGNMVEVDHGNNLVTRYAHASKRLVKVGEVVLRGQKIGEVGTTGRSTGPHLHFEVRKNGAAMNPARFMKMPG